MRPSVIIVGSDKGGVGKTTITRALADYYNKRCKLVDTEDKVKGGVLQRFYPGLTEQVNLGESDGQVQIFDAFHASPLTIIDIKATLLTPTLQALDEVGFIDKAKTNQIYFAVLHVMDGSVTAINEIQSEYARVIGMRYVLVRNHINNRAFLNWPKDVPGTVIDIPKLTEMATEIVDASNLPYSAFIEDIKYSETLRGYTRTWLKKVFEQFDLANLGTV